MKNRAQLQETQQQSARLRMVDDQLSHRGIKDPAVLAAMSLVPRHEFVQPGDVVRAYGDHPLDIGYEQTISQPFVVASMTEELHLISNSKVLEIGTGCGYQTAILAEIAGHVYTIERIPELQRDAMKRLGRLGYSNITGAAGDGSLGWEEHAPFDAILVTAAAAEMPQNLMEQLANPGRMVIPVGRFTSEQELRLIEKDDTGIRQTVLYGVRFVPLWTSQVAPPDSDESDS